MALKQTISSLDRDGGTINHAAALMQPKMARELLKSRHLLPVTTGRSGLRNPSIEAKGDSDLRYSSWKPRNIAFKSKGKIYLLDPAKILSAEARCNYVILQQIAESYLLREQISVLAGLLEPLGFIQIHRSVLVNAALVDELEPLSKGEYLLRMRGGREYSVTRTYRHKLKCLACSWIGFEPEQ
jgi:DNA-binding LytR/AlgR family response regulator